MALCVWQVQSTTMKWASEAHAHALPLILRNFSDDCVPAFIHRLLNDFMRSIMHGETNCSSQVLGVAGIGLDKKMGGVSGVSHEA